MLQSNKTKILAAIAVIGFMSFAGQAFSQGYCYYDNWSRNVGSAWWNNNVPVQYTLTAKQINQMNVIRADFNEKIIPQQNRLRSLEIEYRGYASRPDADMGKIKSMRKEIRDLEDKIADARLTMRGNINKILTKEQRLYFNNDGYGWWDGGNNWWCMDGDMGYDYDSRYNNYRGGMMHWRSGWCCR